RYYPVDWSDEVRTSPTQPYDKSVSVARSYVASIGSLIISPGSTGSELVNSADISGITYLAPVTQSGGDSPWLLAFRVSNHPLATNNIGGHAYGSRAASMITCDEDIGKYRFVVTGFHHFLIGQTYWWHGIWNYPSWGTAPTVSNKAGTLYDYGNIKYADFDPGVPSTQTFIGRFAGLDLHGVARYDGNRTITVDSLAPLVPSLNIWNYYGCSALAGSGISCSVSTSQQCGGYLDYTYCETVNAVSILPSQFSW
ncbi:MAG: hypothetical protein KKG92_05500, partial [Gammaproteobacteria bacterium]|nr:hypothetical protein [Gammaproteobacteria bacterium]